MVTSAEQATRHDQLVSHDNKIIEFLRAEAFDVACDLGAEELCSPEGIDNVVDATL